MGTHLTKTLIHRFELGKAFLLEQPCTDYLGISNYSKKNKNKQTNQKNFSYISLTCRETYFQVVQWKRKKDLGNCINH